MKRNALLKSGCACAICALAMLVGGIGTATTSSAIGLAETSVAAPAELSIPQVVAPSKPVQALEVWQKTGSNQANVVFRQPRTGPADYVVDLYNVTTAKTVWSVTTSTAPTVAKPITLDIPATGKFAVRVKATNAGGSSTLARAMIDGKIAPVNMLQTGWIKEGDDYRLQLMWNAPNYSPAGQINRYRIYDGKGQVITEVTDEQLLMSVADSKRLQGGVAIEPVADSGAVGPRVKRAEVYPAPGEKVAITSIPANADAHTPLTVRVQQEGFAVGDKGVIEVAAPGSGWEQVGEWTVSGADQDVKIPLTVRGMNQVRVGVAKAGVDPILSEQHSVEVFDQQVTKLDGKVVQEQDAKRYLSLDATTIGVKPGADARLQVKRPGAGTFSDVDSQPVAADGSIKFDQRTAEMLATEDGKYEMRVVLPTPAEGLPEYTSSAITVEATSAAGSSRLWDGTTQDQVLSGIFTVDGQGDAYYVNSNTNPRTIKLSPSGEKTEMTYGAPPAGFGSAVQGGYPDAAPDGTVIQWVLLTEQSTRQRYYAVYEAKPGSTQFEFRQMAVKYEKAPPRPYSVQLGPNNDVFINEPGRISRLEKDATLTTIAGTGTPGFNGESGEATKTQIAYPSKFTWDSAGALYFSDSNNQRVRKIDKAGAMKTVAGNGSIGFDGDGGDATKASLTYPGRPAVAKDGSVYIPTTKYEQVSGSYVIYSKIRKVDSKGSITSVAGVGSPDGTLNPGAAPANLNLFKVGGAWLLPDGSLVVDSTSTAAYVDYSGLVVLKF